MRRFLLPAVVAVILGGASVAGLAGCAAKAPGDATQAGPPATNPFAANDKAVGELVTSEASWQAPEKLTVGETQRIGLTIGEGGSLKRKIDNLMPDTVRSPAGPVQVGPVMRVTLRANPADAVITPSEAVDVSTGSDIQMLWTWLVHPKRPTSGLKLTALLEVPLDNGHTIANEIGFTIQVGRTMLYTLEEVATHWGTWSAIVATLVSVIGWYLRRRNRRRASGDQPPPPPVEPAPAQQLAA